MPRRINFGLFWMLTLCLCLCITNTSNADDAGQVDKPKELACCGGKVSWKWERWVGDEERESGGWSVGPVGVHYTHFQTLNGTISGIIAIKQPRPMDQPFPDLSPDKRYFKGADPAVGMLIAEQVEPGEHWIFQIGDKVLTDEVGFDGGSQHVAIDSKLDGHWYHSWTEMQPLNGFWFYQICGDQLGFIYGSKGCQDTDIEKEGFLKQNLFKLPVPDDVGRCYVLAHAVGEVWTVTVDGKSYTATVVASDIDPSTKMLLDNAPQVAPGMSLPSSSPNS